MGSNVPKPRPSLSPLPTPLHSPQEEEKKEVAELATLKARKEVQNQVCKVCRIWLDGFFVSCKKCRYLLCSACYESILEVGSKSCPNCHTIYEEITGTPSIVGDELHCTADSWECTSKYTKNSKDLVKHSSAKAKYYAKNCRSGQENEISNYSPKQASPPYFQGGIRIPRPNWVGVFILESLP
ncbi:hypothetical protein J5N97_014259 [Dioscorea zingiberensis]|uniref:RING-type domain-containing protein n=1 Tax=Dioscorea zingiberensis TaxID=325984 RepID=A0A9D5CS03_9LILI|nr:hypothetical protein J5N97_014259 [Dioscorea zingiberensis]